MDNELIWDPLFETILRKKLPLIASAVITPDLDLRSSGLDSVAAVELLVELEGTYQIRIEDRFLARETFATPLSLWTAVRGPRHERGDTK